MIVELSKHSVFWRNASPASGGVSNTLSPREILTGLKIDYNRHCRFEYGEYVQTREEHDNSMGSHTVGALVMRPTGNAQGSYYCFSLASGRIINRGQMTKLPMPQEVIDRVHTLARRQKANRGMDITDQRQQPVDDDDEDSSYRPDED